MAPIYAHPTVTPLSDGRYAWTSASSGHMAAAHGVTDSAGTAWYLAMQPSIERLVNLHLRAQQYPDADREEAALKAEAALYSRCQDLPPQVNANYFYTLIGWRIKNARRDANRREAHLRTTPISEAQRIPVSVSWPDTIDLFASIPTEDNLREIAGMLALGCTLSEISRAVGASWHTVERRIDRLRALLQDAV